MGCRLTHVGHHVENSLRISNMASRGKTHTFGRHVEDVFYLKDFMTWLVCKMLSDILFLRAWSSSFSRSIREEKSPYKVGRHVEINLKLIHMAFWV